jgi:hypothetical protein
VEQLMQLLGLGASSSGQESYRPPAAAVPMQRTTPSAAPLPPAPVVERHPDPGNTGNQLSASPAATTPGTRLLQQVLCPITQEPMEDPVTAADGHTYERVPLLGCGLVCPFPYLLDALQAISQHHFMPALALTPAPVPCRCMQPGSSAIRRCNCLPARPSPTCRSPTWRCCPTTWSAT